MDSMMDSNKQEPYTNLVVDMIIFTPTELFVLLFLCNLAGFAIALSVIALYQ